MKTKALHVMHFAYLVNEDDFIDVILKFADKSSFKMSLCTCVKEGNIKTVNFSDKAIQHFVLGTALIKKDFFTSIFRLWRAIRKQHVDVVHAHHYYESLIAMIACFLAGRKLIITRHYHNELYLTTTWLKLKIYLFFESLVNRFASVIISPSSLIQELLIKQGVTERKIKVIPYGFNFSSPKYEKPSQHEIFLTRKHLHYDESDFLVGNFARHHAIKGQDLLLKAFTALSKKNHRARLLMVGDGPSHNTLRNLATELNISEKVMFLGWRKDIRMLLSCVNVVIHPTHQEAYPQIMVETMALEKLLMITPVSGATDLVHHGENGFIIPFRSLEVWMDNLIYIEANPGQCSSMAKRGRDTVIHNLGIGVIIKKIEVVYQTLS